MPDTVHSLPTRRRTGFGIDLPASSTEWLALLIVLGAVAFGLHAAWRWVGDTSRRSRESANVLVCASHLRQIGQAVAAYAAADPGGQFPPDLATLALAQGVPPGALLCPSGDDTPAAAAAGVTAPAHHSYVYCGAGLTTGAPGSAVVAFDDARVHDADGRNVLFADGHVTFLTGPAADHVLNELAAGHNPPRP